MVRVLGGLKKNIVKANWTNIKIKNFMYWKKLFVAKFVFKPTLPKPRQV